MTNTNDIENAATDNAAATAREAEVARIAREFLRIATLVPRNSDSLDFHDVHVEQLKEALEHAYEMGVAAALSGSRKDE